MNSSNISDNDSKKSSKLNLSADEEDTLYRRFVLESVQGELLNWAKKRFWLIAVVAIVFGWVGITVVLKDIIRDELKDATRAGAVAETAAEQATTAAQDVKDALEKYKERIDQLSKEASILSTELKDVKISLASEQNRIEADANHTIAQAQLKVENLEQKLNDLSKLVIKVANNTNLDKNSLAQYRTELDLLTKNQILTESKFTQNSDIKVIVSSKQDKDSSLRSFDVYKKLAQEGYKVTREWFKDTDVFLGKQVVILYPPNISPKALEVKNAVLEVLKDQKNLILLEKNILEGSNDLIDETIIYVLMDVDEKRIDYINFDQWVHP